ncbi:sensor histidine kinase [uncultured Pseudoteredinibacter sp.]|uniref:sensor histidine kinase n=1 Tax=uncultured Pseudoteredinibacter sp. TaxID=1641701 RepID=UPI00263655C6|nr:sensor histidine kinase [uncultured Pseudoteredinibacter sp.]
MLTTWFSGGVCIIVMGSLCGSLFGSLIGDRKSMRWYSVVATLLLTWVDVVWSDFPPQARRAYSQLQAGQLDDSLRTRAMTQDSFGFLWLGGSNGLWRYDGYKLRHIPHRKDDVHTPRDNDIYSVVGDSRGGLWINSSHHISYFDIQSETFKHYSAGEAESGLPITTELNQIFIDSQGGVWFAGYGGLSHLPVGVSKFVNFGPGSGLSVGDDNFVVTSVTVNNRGDVYVATDRGLGFKKKQDKDFRYLFTKESAELKGSALNVVVEDDFGNIWIGSQGGGLFWLDAQGKVHSHERRDGAYKALSESVTWDIVPMGDEVWVFNSTNGVFVIDAHSGEILSHEVEDDSYPYGLKLRDARVGFRLRSGQLLLAGEKDDSGASPEIQMFSPQKDYARWITKTDIGNSRAQEIFTGVKYGDDFLFFGKKVVRYDLAKGAYDDTSEFLKKFSEKIENNHAYLIHADEKGRLWVTTSNTSNWLIDLENETFESIWVGQGRCTPYDSHPLKGGLLAFECEKDAGVLVLDMQSLEQRYFAFDVNAQFVSWSGIEPLDNGDWVLGSSLGLMLLKAEEQNVVGAKFSLVALEGIRSGRVFFDGDRNLWVDTDLGLYFLARGRPWREIELRFPGAEQRFTQFAYRDEQDRVWGREGYLDLKASRFVALNRIDNYHMKGVFLGEPLQFPGGQWAAFNFQGIQIVDSARFDEWNQSVPIQISELRIDGVRQKGVNFPEIELPAQVRKISFDIAALDFEPNKRKQYQYRLKGYNKTWQKGDSENRHVDFENLPPGNYQLQIKASNYRGVLSENELFVDLSVLPAWHQTWWFRSFLLVAALTMVLLFIRYRERYLQGKRKELEGIVAERTSELAEKNETLNMTLDELHTTQESLIEQEKVLALGKMVKGLAHEVNTPLGVAVTAASDIDSRTEALERDFHGGSLSADQLQKLIKILRASSGMVVQNLAKANELVSSFRGLGLDEGGEAKTSIDVFQTIQGVISRYSRRDELEAKVTFECPEKLLVLLNSQDLVEISEQLLENAIKHAKQTEQELTVDINVLHQLGRLELRVRDNGKGIPKDIVKHIFEPFFTTLRAQGGVGLGLSRVYNVVVHKLGGSISVEADLPQGAEFLVVLPCEKLS